jgi:hypothetical protein
LFPGLIFVPHVILIHPVDYIFVPFVVTIYFADYKNLFLFVVMIYSPCNLDLFRGLYFCSLCSHVFQICSFFGHDLFPELIFVPHVILICPVDYIFVPFVVTIYFADYKNLFLFMVMICSPCNLACSRGLCCVPSVVTIYILDYKILFLFVVMIFPRTNFLFSL